MSEHQRFGVVKKGRDEHWNRHPIIVAVVGFLLTGVLGATLTFFYTRLSSERDQMSSRAMATRDAIIATEKALMEFEGATIHLRAELSFGTPPDALLNAFKQYQDSAMHAFSAVGNVSYELFDGGPSTLTPTAKKIEQVLGEVVVDRLTPLLASTSRYVLRTSQGRFVDECDVPSALQGIPVKLGERINVYDNCANALIEIMLLLGTDSDNAVSSDEKNQKKLLTRLWQIEDTSCPSLDLSAKPHEHENYDHGTP
jgi:hypothetical protein